MSVTLRTRVSALTAIATESRSIKKLSTTGSFVHDALTGVRFFVSNKDAAAESGRKAAGAAAAITSLSGAVARTEAPPKRVDPFETPEDALVVERDLTETHYLQLNKFPVCDGHLLVVTKAFEFQTDVATERDFTAISLTLRDIDGFFFFNCGARSGASIPHKHFQMLPRDALRVLESGAGGADEVALAHEIPMEALLNAHLPALPFEPTGLPPPLSSARIAAVRLPAGWVDGGEAATKEVLRAYETLLGVCGLPVSRDGVDHCADTEHPSHNMVMTRDWMVVAAREHDPARLGGNACVLGGFFLVRDDADLEALRNRGPAQAIADLCVAK